MNKLVDADIAVTTTTTAQNNDTDNHNTNNDGARTRTQGTKTTTGPLRTAAASVWNKNKMTPKNRKSDSPPGLVVSPVK